MKVQLSQDTQADYYAILGVGACATTAQVKAAFRLRVKQVHPDRNPSPEATERFIGLTEAYRVLSDAGTRGIYDRARFAAPVSVPGAPPAARRPHSRARAAGTRRARRHPGVRLKAACFAGALIACCSLVVDFGADHRLMAAARADTSFEKASRTICTATPARADALRPASIAGTGAED